MRALEPSWSLNQGATWPPSEGLSLCLGIHCFCSPCHLVRGADVPFRRLDYGRIFKCSFLKRKENVLGLFGVFLHLFFAFFLASLQMHHLPSTVASGYILPWLWPETRDGGLVGIQV